MCSTVYQKEIILPVTVIKKLADRGPADRADRIRVFVRRHFFLVGAKAKKCLQKTRILWLCGHFISHYVHDPAALSPQLSPHPSPLVVSSLSSSCRVASRPCRVVSRLVSSCRVSCLVVLCASRYVSHSWCLMSWRVSPCLFMSSLVSCHAMLNLVY